MPTLPMMSVARCGVSPKSVPRSANVLSAGVAVGVAPLAALEPDGVGVVVNAGVGVPVAAALADEAGDADGAGAFVAFGGDAGDAPPPPPEHAADMPSTPSITIPRDRERNVERNTASISSVRKQISARGDESLVRDRRSFDRSQSGRGKLFLGYDVAFL